MNRNLSKFQETVEGAWCAAIYQVTKSQTQLSVWTSTTTFVSKVISLLFNMVSRFIIAFLPRSKHLLISRLPSTSAVILEFKKIKSVTTSIFCLFICHEVMGTGVMILVFWMLSFKPVFSISSFTLIKRLFSSSSLSAIRVVLISSAYLKFFIFLPAILGPACDSSSLVFHILLCIEVK